MNPSYQLINLEHNRRFLSYNNSFSFSFQHGPRLLAYVGGFQVLGLSLDNGGLICSPETSSTSFYKYKRWQKRYKLHALLLSHHYISHIVFSVGMQTCSSNWLASIYKRKRPLLSYIRSSFLFIHSITFGEHVSAQWWVKTGHRLSRVIHFIYLLDLGHRLFYIFDKHTNINCKMSVI